MDAGANIGSTELGMMHLDIWRQSKLNRETKLMAMCVQMGGSSCSGRQAPVQFPVTRLRDFVAEIACHESRDH